VDRRVTGIVLAGVLCAVLLGVVATGGEVRLWHDPTTGGPSDIVLPVETLPTLPMVTSPVNAEPGKVDGSDLPRWVVIVLRVLFYGGLVVALVAALMSAWRHRPRLSWGAGIPGEHDFEVLPEVDVARSVTDDADAQRAALQRGAPRNAIVECWLRLEDVVSAAGLSRNPADTSAEFTTRVLASYALDPTAVLRLSELYREARFSTHEMDEAQRDAAVDALDSIHDGLRSSVGGSVTTGAVSTGAVSTGAVTTGSEAMRR
jgi:hypothetical protein